MWGRQIQICTQILHRGYVSRDIAHAQWRFALVRHFKAEYLGNGWRYALGHNGTPIGNGCWGIELSHDRWRHVTPKGQGRDFSRVGLESSSTASLRLQQYINKLLSLTLACSKVYLKGVNVCPGVRKFEHSLTACSKVYLTTCSKWAFELQVDKD